MKQNIVDRVFKIYYDLYDYEIEKILLKEKITNFGQVDIVISYDFNCFLKGE